MKGFAPTGRPPDHVIMSRGVDVTVVPLERVGKTPDAKEAPAH